MSLLTKELEENFLIKSPKEKEEIGNKIVEYLGGNPKKMVTNLPKRKGNADGGIDGRGKTTRKFLLCLENKKTTKKEIIQSVDVAFNIKLENKPFSRVYFNSFVRDMERENIYDGVIITIKGLSKDAQRELENCHNSGDCLIEHYTISDILLGRIKSQFGLEKKLEQALKNLKK